MSKREFELDLTSVCVNSGVVQLPLKMQALFTDGDLNAVVDGEDLILTFSHPRRLSGFKQHFERRSLRSNDKVRFEIEVTGEKAVSLSAASIKRERTKPAPQRAGEEPGRAEGSAGDAGRPSSERSPAARGASSWGSSEDSGQVRAVRKVRVEGGTPQPISLATARSGSTTQDGPVQPPAGQGARVNPPAYGGWTPLDGLSPEGDRHTLSLNDYPESTVREIRRSKAPSSSDPVGRSEDRATGFTTPAGEQALPPLYSDGHEVTEQFDEGDRQAAPLDGARPAALAPQAAPTVNRGVEGSNEPIEVVASVPARRDREAPARSQPRPPSDNGMSLEGIQRGFRVTPRIPVPRNTAKGSSWQPPAAPGFDGSVDDTTARSPGDAVTAPVALGRQPRLIEETDLNHGYASVNEVAAQVGAQENSTAGLGSEPGTAMARTVPVAPTTAIDDAEFGGDYLPDGRSLEIALQRNRTGATGEAGVAQTAYQDPRREPEPTTDPVGQDRVVPPAPPAAASAPAGPEASVARQAAAPVRIEDDLRMVLAYLDRPNTPAIVRSEVIAAELGMDDQRSERALERLSENRDRVSRIRKGAYMVKSGPARTSARL